MGVMAAWIAVKSRVYANSQILMKTTSQRSDNGLKQPTSARIIRAVASSTAIETGQSIKELEARLLAQDSKFQQIPLASA
jgi:hypothetical protein